MPEFPHFVLADFDNPPVVETVLSAQFERLAAMRTVHLGLFWRKVQMRFPKAEDRPVLAPMFERFPEPSTAGGRIRFEAIEIPKLPRLWLLNNPETEMIQIQDDRFIKNWRKAGEEDPYPHYEPVIKPAFERDFQDFQSFLREEGLGEVKVNQCEVTYVNHLVSGEGWQQLGEIDRLFTFCKPTAIPVPGTAEDYRVQIRFPIPNEDGKPIGRLHVDVQPAVRAGDGRPMYVVNLTARGQYGEGFGFFDIGRQWIVKSFEQLTTDHMHRIWRKK
jgi:uncharacterized protein (TIGR04255 family)